MKTGVSTSDATIAATTVAPEDLKCGDYVAVMKELIEVPSYLWVDSLAAGHDTLVRLRCIPAESGMPLKIKAICLPFVFVKPPIGPFATIDLRRVQLVRLDATYGKTVWRCLREQSTPADPLEAKT